MKAFARLFSICLLGSASLLAADSAATTAAATNAQHLRAYRDVAFTTAASVAVAKLDGAERLGLRRFLVRSFHRYRLVSSWKTLDASASQALARLLREQIDAQIEFYRAAGNDEAVRLNSFCVPQPGFAVRLQTDRGPRDVLICLDCSDVTVFGDDPHGVEFSVDPEVTLKLKASYQAEMAAAELPKQRSSQR
jgi:hypothetical protein